MAIEKAKALQERTIEVQVAKRKSVDHDGVIYGPGSKLVMVESEAKSLYLRGFIVEPDEDDTDAAGSTASDEASLSVQSNDQAA